MYIYALIIFVASERGSHRTGSRGRQRSYTYIYAKEVLACLFFSGDSVRMWTAHNNGQCVGTDENYLAKLSDICKRV